MNCPSCGTNNLDTSSICVNCGRPLTAPPPPPPPPPHVPRGLPHHTAAQHASGVPIPNYLVRSVFATLCCCLPLGVLAIIFGAQVNSKLASGDVAGAMQASENARKLSFYAIIIGVIVIILGIVFNGGLALLSGLTGGVGHL